MVPKPRKVPEKKKKRTKKVKEAERIAAAEEAAKVRKAEEERLAKEKTEADRLEQVELERRIESRNGEVAKLLKNHEEISEIKIRRHATLEESLRRQNEADNWECTLRANEETWTNMTLTRNLNTYISEKSEMKLDFKEALHCGDDIDRFMHDLNVDLLSSHGEETVSKEKWLEFVPTLCELISEKVDEATFEVLKNCDMKYICPESHVSPIRETSKTMRAAIWMMPPTQTTVTLGGDKELDMTIRVQTALAGYAIRLCCFPFDTTEPHAEESQSFVVLGGTMHLDILTHVPPPKQVENWTFRKHTRANSSIEKNSYPTEPPEVECSLRVNKALIIPEDVKLAWWDENKREWITNATDHEFDQENYVLTFRTRAFGTIAMIQSPLIEFCYHGWEVGPVFCNEEDYSKEDAEVVQLTITTERFNIMLWVKGHQCTLKSPDLPQLAHLKHQLFSPQDILANLRNCGINLLPTNKDGAQLKITMKTSDIEDRMCEDVSWLSTSFLMKSSTLNRELGKDKGCYLIEESAVYTGGSSHSGTFIGVTEVDCKSDSVLNAPGANHLPPECGNVKSFLLSGQRISTSDSLNATLRRATNSCLHMIQCLKPNSTPEVKRTYRTDPVLANTVKQLLLLTRPFCFC